MSDLAEPPTSVDLAVVGAGAAGLMAAIVAGRAAAARGERLSIIAVDGARTLGAKILVAGGGRCNVTHHAVDEKAYAGSSPNAVRNVLRRFGVAHLPREVVYKRVVFKFLRAAFSFVCRKARGAHPLGGGGYGRGGPEDLSVRR